jgi:hypothetical protein
MSGASILEERVTAFEDLLAELIIEYDEKRIADAFCSEADIRMHPAHKVLDKLPYTDVHAELPIPLDIKKFDAELLVKGRIGPRNCVKADIAIIDSENSCPQIIAELKFTPLYWGFQSLLAVPRGNDEETKRVVAAAISRDLGFLQRKRSEKPNQKQVEDTYFGPHKNGPTTVEKMIQIINRFKTEQQKDVRGYLIVFDEIYPNVEEILNEAIDHYNPPDTFKIIATYRDLADILQDTLKKLTVKSNE